MASAEVSIRRLARPVHRVLQSDFLRHSALVFVATMTVNVLNYAFNFALSRRLGVEGFATLASLVGVFMILSIPANVVNLVVVKYASEFHALDERARVQRLAGVVLRFAGMCSLGLIAIGVILRGPLAAFLRIDDAGTITLSLAIVAVAFMTPGMRGILQGRQDFTHFSVSTILEIVVKVALGISLAYAGFGVAGALGGWLCGSAIGLLYTIWAVRRGRSEQLAGVSLNLDVRRLAKTTIGVALATAALTVLSFMDVVLVKHFFDARDAGIYAAVNLTGKVVLFFVSFLPMVVLPKAVATAQSGGDPVPLLVKAGAITVVMAGSVLAVFGTAPATIVHLVAGNAFLPAAPYVVQYDAAMAMLAVVTLLVTYKIGLHRFEFLYGLTGVVVVEAVAIAVWHNTISDVVHVLLAGNALAILACSFGLRARAGRVAA